MTGIYDSPGTPADSSLVQELRDVSTEAVREVANKELAVSDEAEHAIEEVLEGRPRAIELREMIGALESRREILQRELGSAAPASRKAVRARLDEVDRQIRVLREEQAITAFVEDSVRASVNRSAADVDTFDG